MADDYGYILSFNNSSGLPPDVVAKLNNNFYHLKNMFTDPEIVMAAGVELPDPRTTETLFYKTDTGQLYIWRFFPGDPDYGTEDTWDWSPLDINLIHIDTQAPSGSSYIRNGEVIWYDNNANMPYFWYEPTGSSGGARWYSIEEIIRGIVNSMS